MYILENLDNEILLRLKSEKFKNSINSKVVPYLRSLVFPFYLVTRDDHQSPPG